MKHLLLLLIVPFLFIGCGDDDDGHTNPTPKPCTYTYVEGECQPDNTQVLTVVSAEPSGCIGEPLLFQPCTYIPPAPEDCCPDQESVLRCGDCPSSKPCKTTQPDITVYCTGGTEPYWYLKIGWGIIVVDVEPYDTSCCPVENTGLCYEICNRLTPCNAHYAYQPTEWYIFGDYNGYWYVYSDRTYYSYRIFVNAD